MSLLALLLAAVSLTAGAQGLLFAALSLGVFVLSGLIATGMFYASAKLGLLSIRARHLTILFEVLLFVPGVALWSVGSYAAQHAGTPANPGTDGPFADGGDSLIALMGMAYAAGAIVITGLLLFAPAVRKSFRS
jgi:hypothetical protein